MFAFSLSQRAEGKLGGVKSLPGRSNTQEKRRRSTNKLAKTLSLVVALFFRRTGREKL